MNINLLYLFSMLFVFEQSFSQNFYEEDETCIYEPDSKPTYMYVLVDINFGQGMYEVSGEEVNFIEYNTEEGDDPSKPTEYNHYSGMYDYLGNKIGFKEHYVTVNCNNVPVRMQSYALDSYTRKPCMKSHRPSKQTTNCKSYINLQYPEEPQGDMAGIQSGFIVYKYRDYTSNPKNYSVKNLPTNGGGYTITVKGTKEEVQNNLKKHCEESYDLVIHNGKAQLEEKWNNTFGNPVKRYTKFTCVPFDKDSSSTKNLKNRSKDE
ncbi:hypothetical protein N9N67_04330 [Bacteriovoracaceae bacterium]|nr:hypothetical protein [Bacteriovoracaceae bacterium]